MLSEKNVCYFFDASVIIAEVLKENKNQPRINKMKEHIDKYHIPSFVTESVVKECKERIDKTVNFVGDQVPKIIGSYLEEKGLSNTTEISKIDIKDFEELFLPSYKSSGALHEALSNIEYGLICFLEKINTEDPKTSIDTFMVKFTSDILGVASDIDLRFKGLINPNGKFACALSLAPDAEILNKLTTNCGLKNNDAVNIASIYSYPDKGNKKCVFVTLDRETILFKKKSIKIISSIACTDPLYAIHQ